MSPVALVNPMAASRSALDLTVVHHFILVKVHSFSLTLEWPISVGQDKEVNLQE